MRLVLVGVTVGLSSLIAVGTASAQGFGNAEPLAVLNGKTITSAEVDSKLRGPTCET